MIVVSVAVQILRHRFAALVRRRLSLRSAAAAWRAPVWLSLGVLLLGTGCSALKEEAGAPAAPPVEALPARSGTLPLVERLSGTVRAENQVALFPQISGRVAEVLAGDGQRVEAGALLVRLQDDAIREQVRQAEAGLRIEQARLRQARAALGEIEAQERRMKTLGERNLVSEVELETLAARRESAAADVELAEAQVERAEASLAERREDLDRTLVRAPVAGVVGQRAAEVGMQVTPATRLFVIGNLDRVIVRVLLTDAMLRYLREGQPVRVYPHDDPEAAEASSLDATLARISPFLNETTRSTEADIELSNAEGRLRPGMFVPVDVRYGESQAATLVPNSALYTDPNTGSEGMFVLASAPPSPIPSTEDDAGFSPPVPVEFRPIVAVARGAGETAVANLAAGEWVVTLGQNLLATGRSEARVRSVTWDHVRELQSLKRQNLLREVLRPATR